MGGNLLLILMKGDAWHCWDCLEILSTVGLTDRIRSQAALCITAFSHLKSVTELQMVFTPIISLLLLNRTGRGVVYPISLVQLKHRAASLLLKLLFLLHVSHKEAKECEICDSLCGFVTCMPRLKMIEILVLSHFGVGKYVSFVAFVGFSFKLSFLNEEEQYLSFWVNKQRTLASSWLICLTFIGPNIYSRHRISRQCNSDAKIRALRKL